MCTVSNDHTKQEATLNTRMVTLETKEPTANIGRMNETEQAKPEIPPKSKDLFSNRMNAKRDEKWRNCRLIGLMHTRTESWKGKKIIKENFWQKKSSKIQKVCAWCVFRYYSSNTFMVEYSFGPSPNDSNSDRGSKHSQYSKYMQSRSVQNLMQMIKTFPMFIITSYWCA